MTTLRNTIRYPDIRLCMRNKYFKSSKVISNDPDIPAFGRASLVPTAEDLPGGQNLPRTPAVTTLSPMMRSRSRSLSVPQTKIKPSSSTRDVRGQASVLDTGFTLSDMSSDEELPSRAAVRPSLVQSTASLSKSSSVLPRVSPGPVMVKVRGLKTRIPRNGMDLVESIAGLPFAERCAFGDSFLEGAVAWRVQVQARIIRLWYEQMTLCELGFVPDIIMEFSPDKEDFAQDVNQAFTVKVILTKVQLLMMCRWGESTTCKWFKGNYDRMRTLKFDFVFRWDAPSKEVVVQNFADNEPLWVMTLNGFEGKRICPMFKLGKAVENNLAIVTLRVMDLNESIFEG